MVFVQIPGDCPGRQFILCMLNSLSFGLLHYCFVLSLSLKVYVVHLRLEFLLEVSVTVLEAVVICFDDF